MNATTTPRPVVCGALVRPSSFVAAETNPANGPTPSEALAAATKRLEAVAYARGFDAALSRLEMLAAVCPESVTKAQLVEMLKREVVASIGEWNATQRPNGMDEGRRTQDFRTRDNRPMSRSSPSFCSSSLPWWAWLFIVPAAVMLSPIGTIILTAWLHLDFAGCCKLIAGQVIVFLNLAIFAGGED